MNLLGVISDMDLNASDWERSQIIVMLVCDIHLTLSSNKN